MIYSLLKKVDSIRKSCSAVDLVRCLPLSARKGRLFVAGDIHGEFNVLMSALHALGFDFQQDTLLLVGDLHDRGPNSANCLELLQEPWLLSTLGNHEWMLLSVVAENGSINYGKKGALELFIANGGEWILEKPDTVRQKWRNLLLEKVPLYWLVERRDGRRVMVCHAEPSPEMLPDVLSCNSRKIEIAGLGSEQTIWGRNTLYNASRRYLSRDILQQMLLPLEGVLFSVHGHSYVKTAAWINNQLFLDTGTAMGKKLTVIDIDHVIPGMCNGINGWSIMEQRLLECEAMRLWPA